MLKKLALSISLFMAAAATMGCGSEESYSMCNCEGDEICVDNECKPYPDDFAPAPAE